VAAPDGQEPASPEAWGWRAVTIGVGENERTEWRPQGRRVGWVDGEDLYLEPNAAYRAAQAIGRDTSDPLCILSRTLHKRLKERGLLRSVETPHLMVRKVLESRRQRVLHLDAEILASYPPESGPTGPTGPPRQSSDSTGPQNGPDYGPLSPHPEGKVGHGSGPQQPLFESGQPPGVPVGPLGPVLEGMHVRSLDGGYAPPQAPPEADWEEI
jgi:hypothetical protein